MSLVQGYSSEEDLELEKIPQLPVFGLSVAPEVAALDILVAPTESMEKTYFGEIAHKHSNEADFKLQQALKRGLEGNLKKNAKRLKKLRRSKGDPENLDFLGPWAGSKEDEKSENKENDGEDETSLEDADLDVMEAESDPENEFSPVTTEFFGSDNEKAYLTVPKDVKIDLLKEPGSQECFVPKKVVHTFTGHQKGVTKLAFFPRSGHLLLLGGNDGKIFLWDAYHKRGLLRGFNGHNQAIRDVIFNSAGDRFLSCSYDRWVILWDTESGEILHKVRVGAIPNVLLFNPNNMSEFLVGLSNRNIEHYEIQETMVLIQTYDHHLGAINSLTAIDGNRRFMSTADDKAVRFWDWHVNIPIKVISEPSQHLMPRAAVSPDGKHIALQCMDNSVLVLQGHGKFRLNTKKRFSGHNVAGYGIGIEFSPDGKTLISGDSRGFVFFWDWKTSRMVTKMKVSPKVMSCVVAHPQEASMVAAAGISGEIYLCG